MSPCFKNSLLLVLVWLFCVCFMNAFAIGREPQKDMQIEGRVLNKDGNPIPNVSVYFSSFPSLGTVTDSSGFFRLSCREGAYTVIFSHIGYQQLEARITVSENETGKQVYEIHLKEKNSYLREVFVSGHVVSTAVAPERAVRAHRLIAGGTSVALMKPEEQRLETIKDALKYEPGVIIQEFFGANDQPRLSIRGSGIQSNPQRRGVYLLQDGIPVNFADGSFIIGVMDPSISEAVEVFKGANALRYGAAALGGAINFNSRTGRYSPGIQLKAEAGSYGYSAFSILAGQSYGKKDVFLSVSGSRQDGFRQHNKNKKLNVAGNFGYRISDKTDNRTYLNYSYINFNVPGPLTLDMIKEDPAQINKGVNLPYVIGPDIERDKPGREATVMRVANRTAVRLSSSADLLVSLYYQHIQDRFVFPIVLSTQRSAGNDAGINIQAAHYTQKSTLTAGLIGSYGSIDRRGHINKNGLDSYMFSKDKLNAVNLTFYTEYNYRINSRLRIIANLQAAYNERNSRDVFPDPGLRPWYSHASHKYRYFYSENISLSQSYNGLNPRIGAIYNAGEKKNIQFFGNISTSYEPPTFDDLAGTAVTDNINTSPRKLFATKLDKQTAITAEIGSRHEGTRYGWNFSVYRSWLHNELLEVKDFVLGIKETKNYAHTIHQGIELGWMAVPVQGIFNAGGKDRLVVRGMYTYSDFYFSSKEYKNNKLAGVPPHYLTGFLEYRYPGKMFLSFNVESQPEKSPIDHTNTFYQPPFTIYGFRAGFEGWKNISFYVEGKNIFNRHYASSYIISDQILLPPIPFPQFTVDNVAFFMPGQERAFYIGLTYKLPSSKTNPSGTSK